MSEVGLDGSLDVELTQLLSDVRNQREKRVRYGAIRHRSFADEIVRRKGLENDALETNIDLKKMTLKRLLNFLAWETWAVFMFALLQGTKVWGFALEEWSFKLLTTVTIIQITFMLQVAVRHLFPQKG